MARFSNFNQTFNQTWKQGTQPLMLAFANLSRRDQVALLALLAFLLIFGVGFGGWTLHEKANASQKAYDNTLNDVFWLRSQAGNINPTQASTTSKSDTIRQILAQSGIMAQVVDNQHTVQVSFSHNQASVVSNVFSQMAAQGVAIQQLQINQPTPDKLEVQAVFSTK